jgi:hypothetical protein
MKGISKQKSIMAVTQRWKMCILVFCVWRCHWMKCHSYCLLLVLESSLLKTINFKINTCNLFYLKDIISHAWKIFSCLIRKPGLICQWHKSLLSFYFVKFAIFILGYICPLPSPHLMSADLMPLVLSMFSSSQILHWKDSH